MTKRMRYLDAMLRVIMSNMMAMSRVFVVLALAVATAFGSAMLDVNPWSWSGMTTLAVLGVVMSALFYLLLSLPLRPVPVFPKSPLSATPVIVAPWTDEQVDALNAWQAAPRYQFTCGHCGRPLIATRYRWICRHDSYTQDWAHGFMLNGPLR